MPFKMAPFSLFCLTFTFLAISSTAGQLSFNEEPRENYYIMKKAPAIIECSARNAEEINFNCNGRDIPESSVETERDYNPQETILTGKLQVKRTDLRNWMKKNKNTPFWCQCIAMDYTGEQITSRKSYISQAQMAKNFKRNPENTEVMEGDRAVFECESPNARPAATITWRKNKKRVNVDGDSRIQISDSGSLIIDQVNDGDVGFYQCVAKNIAGRRESKEAELTLSSYMKTTKAMREFPETTRSRRRSDEEVYYSQVPDESYYITEDKMVEMHCVANGKVSFLTFRCNGQRMARDYTKIDQGQEGNNRIFQGTLKLSYSIVNEYMRAYPGKPYQCVCVAWYSLPGKREYAQKHTDANRGIIHLSYLDPVFQEEPPAEMNAGLNTDITLPCEAPKGNPRPYIKWYKDNRQLDTDDIRLGEKYEVSNKGYLTIKKVSYDDSGVYNCRAENTVGHAISQRSRLIVLEESEEPTIDTKVMPTKPSPKSFPNPIPESATFLADLMPEYKVTPTGSVELVCSIVSASRLTISCNNRRIDANDINLEEETMRDDKSGKSLIYLKYNLPASEIRGDRYRCQCVSWSIGADRQWKRVVGEFASFKIVDEIDEPEVDEKRPFINDDFIKEPESTESMVGDEVVFMCQAPAGLPVPTIYWMKDGRRIDADRNIHIDDDFLSIDPARLSDRGMYTCVAENQAGQRISRPARLDIEEDDDRSCEEIIPACMDSFDPKYVQVELGCQNRHCFENVLQKCGNYEGDLKSKIIEAKAFIDHQCNQLNNIVKCPEIRQCSDELSNNMHDISDEISLSVGELCGAASSEPEMRVLLSSFVSCMNNALNQCGLEDSQQEVDSIADMLSMMCSSFYAKDVCGQMDECRLTLTPVENNTNHFWCRTFNTIHDCAYGVEESCQESDSYQSELTAIEMDLKSSFQCSNVPVYPSVSHMDMDSTPETEIFEPVIVPEKDSGSESEMEMTTEDDSEAEPTTGMFDNMDKDMTTNMDEMDKSSTDGQTDKDMMETSPETTEETEEPETPEVSGIEENDSESGASIAMSSILLTTCIQLILATLLSWR